MKTEFISYKPVEGESYLGIVTIRRHGQDIIRFKWVKKKDGTGTFHSAPGIKDKDEEGERYVSSFMVDSRSDEAEMAEIIRKGVNETLKVKGIRPVQMEMSALQQQSYQPKSSTAQEAYDDIPF